MNSQVPSGIRLTEVGPRDGLQNEAGVIPTDVKASFVRALLDAGHRDIEVSSFVRPDVVPQLADAEALFGMLGKPPAGVVFGALVPNERGLERALATGSVGKVSVFTAASETFNHRNVNTSIQGSIDRFRLVVGGAKAAGLVLRAYVSTAFVCPYEGPIEPEAVRALCLRLLELGCDELSIGDTIGAATPRDVAQVLDALLPVVPLEKLVLHFHDTRGTAIANLVEGLRYGVNAYDASSGGVGGCPFAPRAAGNLATEDALYLLDRWDISHGIDLGAQKAASEIVAPFLGHPLASRVAQAPIWPAPEEND